MSCKSLSLKSPAGLGLTLTSACPRCGLIVSLALGFPVPLSWVWGDGVLLDPVPSPGLVALTVTFPRAVQRSLERDEDLAQCLRVLLRKDVLASIRNRLLVSIWRLAGNKVDFGGSLSELRSLCGPWLVAEEAGPSWGPFFELS